MKMNQALQQRNEDQFRLNQNKQNQKIAKAQLIEKALYYYGEIDNLTPLKLPRLAQQQSKEYSQYLESDEQYQLQSNNNKNESKQYKRLDELNLSEIRIKQPSINNKLRDGDKIETTNTNNNNNNNVMNNQSGLSDSIKKQFDYNILRSQQKSRVKLSSIMNGVNNNVYNEHKNINLSYLDSKRSSITNNTHNHQQQQKEYNQYIIQQIDSIKQQCESVSTQCQTPLRKRTFASPTTFTNSHNTPTTTTTHSQERLSIHYNNNNNNNSYNNSTMNSSRLNKSACMNNNLSSISQSPTNRRNKQCIRSEEVSPVRQQYNTIDKKYQLQSSYLNTDINIKNNLSEHKKVFTNAYDFTVGGGNHLNQSIQSYNNNNSSIQSNQNYQRRSRSISQTDELIHDNQLNEQSYQQQQQPSKIFTLSEPSLDQILTRNSLQFLDHSIAPNKPQKNSSITSLSYIHSPSPTSKTNPHKIQRRSTRFPSVQPLPSLIETNEKKKRSESVVQQQDKHQQQSQNQNDQNTTILLRRKNSGVSSCSNATSISRMSENNVIRSIKKMVQNRININQLQIHQDPDCRRLLNHFTNKWYDLITSIQRKDLEHALFLIIQLLNTLVDLNDSNCFLNMLLFLSKVYIDFQDYDKAIFFLSQGKIICDYSQNFQKKIEFLKMLAQCSNAIKDYKSAIIILKKALQYAWILKDKHQEIFIYDRLGLNYYYAGDLDTSRFYHERFMSGDSECLDSPNRQMAEQDIQEYLYQLDCKTDGFSRLLFGKLSLPIINIYDNDKTNSSENQQNEQQQQQNNNQNVFNFINQHHEQNTCDKYKIFTYKTCDGRILIDSMMKESEFKFEVPRPIYSQIQKNEEERLQFYIDIGEPIEEPRIKKRMALPQVLVQELVKRKKEKEKSEQKNRNLNDASKYKIPNQTRVKIMLNDKETYESTIERVQKLVKFSCYNQEITQQVFLNHLDEDRQKMLNEKIHDPYALKKRYENLLSDIVAEFILRKNGQNTSDIYII